MNTWACTCDAPKIVRRHYDLINKFTAKLCGNCTRNIMFSGYFFEETIKQSEIVSQDKVKACSLCGQGMIPFKKGVCICGMQIGDIQYVKSPEKFAEDHYSFMSKNNASTA